MCGLWNTMRLFISENKLTIQCHKIIRFIWNAKKISNFYSLTWLNLDFWLKCYQPSCLKNSIFPVKIGTVELLWSQYDLVRIETEYWNTYFSFKSYVKVPRQFDFWVSEIFYWYSLGISIFEMVKIGKIFTDFKEI